MELDDGQLLIAVGDVAGHSIHAATVMVELRHALRAYALEGHRPSRSSTARARCSASTTLLEFATLCVLLLDQERNELTVANAGHLRPLILENGKSSYLQVEGPCWDYGVRTRRTPSTSSPRAGHSCSSLTAWSRIRRSTWTSRWRTCGRP